MTYTNHFRNKLFTTLKRNADIEALKTNFSALINAIKAAKALDNNTMAPEAFNHASENKKVIEILANNLDLRNALQQEGIISEVMTDAQLPAFHPLTALLCKIGGIETSKGSFSIPHHPKNIHFGPYCLHNDQYDIKASEDNAVKNIVRKKDRVTRTHGAGISYQQLVPVYQQIMIEKMDDRTLLSQLLERKFDALTTNPIVPSVERNFSKAARYYAENPSEDATLFFKAAAKNAMFAKFIWNNITTIDVLSTNNADVREALFTKDIQDVFHQEMNDGKAIIESIADKNINKAAFHQLLKNKASQSHPKALGLFKAALTHDSTRNMLAEIVTDLLKIAGAVFNLALSNLLQPLAAEAKPALTTQFSSAPRLAEKPHQAIKTTATANRMGR